MGKFLKFKKVKLFDIYRHIDRFFFVFSLFYFILVLFWIGKPQSIQQNSINNQQKKTHVSDSQFIFYLQQSINLIKQAKIENKNGSGFLADGSNIDQKKCQAHSQNLLSSKNTSITSVAIPPPPPITSSVTIPSTTAETPQLSSSPLNSLTQNDIKLIGVIESGPNSQALFKVNSVTKRLQIGDTVGDSGWIFQGVIEQRAMLSKNGKTRYIEVGQFFD
jgi:hypothetical protein